MRRAGAILALLLFAGNSAAADNLTRMEWKVPGVTRDPPGASGFAATPVDLYQGMEGGANGEPIVRKPVHTTVPAKRLLSTDATGIG